MNNITKFPISLLSLMLFLLLQPIPVYAATITVHANRNCHGNYGICQNIKRYQCCHFNNNGRVASAFYQIPDNAVGGTFTKSSQYLCDQVTNKRTGPGCLNGGGASRGAGYNCCVSGAGRPGAIGARSVLAEAAKLVEENWECTQSVPVQIGVIGGKRFKMDGGVPLEDVEALTELMVDGAGYNDVPARLRQYELK